MAKGNFGGPKVRVRACAGGKTWARQWVHCQKASWVGVVLFIAVLLLATSGCSNTPMVSVSEKQVQQQFKGKSIPQALKATEVMMVNAQQQGLAFYSPGFFDGAKKALETAKFLILAPKESAGEGDAEVLTQLALAQQSLREAEATKSEVQKRLQSVLLVRDSLVSKGIDQSKKDEYAVLMDSLGTLFRRVEQNKLDGFAHAEKITLRQFRRLEAQSVKAQQLDQIITALEQVESMGAEGAAPKSYKKTHLALENARTVIESDPNNQVAIKIAVARFAFEAEHLLHVTQGVKELRALNDTAMENIILAAELRLLAIADALGVADPRQDNLRQQTEILANAARHFVDPKGGGGIIKPRSRHVNKNELDAAQLHIEQLQAQLRDKKAQNLQLKREQKPLVQRIESLERVVVTLNNEKAEMEVALSSLTKETAPPVEGVEITPIVIP